MLCRAFSPIFLHFLSFCLAFSPHTFTSPSLDFVFVLEPKSLMEMGSFQLKSLMMPIIHLCGVMAQTAHSHLSYSLAVEDSEVYCSY